MRQKCEYCGTPYCKGEFIDIGVGFMRVTADEPSCDCEYVAYMEQERELYGNIEDYEEDEEED